jgi:hypothetical protein
MTCSAVRALYVVESTCNPLTVTAEVRGSSSYVTTNNIASAPPGGIQGAITIPRVFFEYLGMLIVPRNSLKSRLLVDPNPTPHNGLSENLVHLLTNMLAARRLQVAHRALHVGMTEPLLNGTQISDTASRTSLGICGARSSLDRASHVRPRLSGCRES